jgi:HK97 family phage major capsid protein
MAAPDIDKVLTLRDRLADLKLIPRTQGDAQYILTVASQALKLGDLSPDEYRDIMEGKSMSGTTTKAAPEKVFGNGNSGGTSRTRVKPAGDQYSDKRASAVHVKTGRIVFDEFGDEVTRPSQRSLALNGAVLKYAARRAGIETNWSEHDQALFNQAVNDFEWASFSGEPDQCKIYAPGMVKAPLLDDSTSGGLEAAPIVFDQDFITTPLLTGELLPEVDLKPIARGRRIEGGSISTPTAVWGEGDASVGTIFDSTGQVAALDSTVYDLSCHVLVGRNFIADTPLNVGTILMQLIGERMLNELEKVIAVGTGSQPSGIMGASGTTAVNFSSAAVTIAKMLELLFAVPKELRGPGFAFCSNEVSYRRLRAVQTGISGDTRLALGSEVESFVTFNRPHKICHHLANTQQFAGDLKAYRLYRRLGSQIEWTTQGENLQRRNEALCTVRQRWAGRATRGASFAVVSDSEA